MEIKLANEALNPSFITLFLLKLSSKGDEISISDTLKVLANKKLVEKIIINRTKEIKNIYTFCNLNNLFKTCILYSNEKTKIYL
tara:strand:+ start:293 stop:544 length:252 start_codon:yes stop_codon:yes gene_type:complete